MRRVPKWLGLVVVAFVALAYNAGSSLEGRWGVVTSDRDEVNGEWPIGQGPCRRHLRRVPDRGGRLYGEHRGDAYAKDGAALPLALQREAEAAILRTTTAIVSALHHAGVPLLAGTDVGNPLLVPGYSLHKEVGAAGQRGAHPLEALRTATLHPVRFLDATDSVGMVAPGKLADLVLLHADPLAEISNAQRIRAVVTDGRLYDRADLDRILDPVGVGTRSRQGGA